MKITRVRYPSATGRQSMAFVAVRFWEWPALYLAAKTGRHNLRRSRNWPGLRLHDARFVLRAKGRPNVDAGRRPGPSLFERKLMERRLTEFEVALLLGLTSALQLQAWGWAAGVGLAGGLLARQLRLRERQAEEKRRK